MSDYKREYSLDILRGIAIIIMVMGHAGFGSLFDNYKVAFNMPIFFLISGYLYNADKNNDFILFLKKKFRTLMIPYLFFAGVTIIVCCVINFVSRETVYEASRFFKGMIWSNQGIFPITGALWYLQCIFVVELLFFMAVRYFKKYWFCVPVICFVLAFIFSVYQIHLPFSADSALAGTVFFAIGFLIKGYNNRRKNLICLKVWVLPLLFVISFIMIRWNGFVNPRTCEYGEHYLLFYINAIAASWLYLNVAKVIDKWTVPIIGQIRKFMIYVGQESLIFLGFNQLFLAGSYAMICRLMIADNSIMKAERNILYFIIAFAALCLISLLFKKTRLKCLIGRK